MKQPGEFRPAHRFAALVFVSVCLACGSGPKGEPAPAAAPIEPADDAVQSADAEASTAAVAPVEAPGGSPHSVCPNVTHT